MEKLGGEEKRNVLIEVVERYRAEVIAEARQKADRDDTPCCDFFTAMATVLDRWRKAGELEDA